MSEEEKDLETLESIQKLLKEGVFHLDVAIQDIRKAKAKTQELRENKKQ